MLFRSDENEKICKKCHTPLSNAVYNQVSSGNDINQPAPKRKSFVPIVELFLSAALSQAESEDTFITFPA